MKKSPPKIPIIVVRLTNDGEVGGVGEVGEERLIILLSSSSPPTPHTPHLPHLIQSAAIRSAKLVADKS